MKIRFNKPPVTGGEIRYLEEVIASGVLAGNGEFTKRCQRFLESLTGANKALLTHSCTGALEMGVILANVMPGDEVIMPSFTFVSTANAVVLRGGVPVFVDIRADTLNMDEALLANAITERTRAIMPIHYAGVGAEMDQIMGIADKHELVVIEDAAQGICSRYKNRHLGSIGHLGALSFHETKNIVSGEGGALLVNDEKLKERAEIIWEKGTNRSQFFRGEVDKYTWLDVGSSFLPSELSAAFLYSQLDSIELIIEQRLKVWRLYQEQVSQFAEKFDIQMPIVPDTCVHNGHIFYLVMPTAASQETLIEYLRERGLGAVFHYIPLHSAPAGKKYGRIGSKMDVTDDLFKRLVRLPVWYGMTDAQVSEVCDAVKSCLSRGSGA